MSWLTFNRKMKSCALHTGGRRGGFTAAKSRDRPPHLPPHCQKLPELSIGKTGRPAVSCTGLLPLRNPLVTAILIDPCLLCLQLIVTLCVPNKPPHPYLAEPHPHTTSPNMNIVGERLSSLPFYLNCVPLWYTRPFPDCPAHA